jgi:hypothetical protein
LFSWNVLYIVVLVICFALIGPVRRIPWDAIHSKIDSSTTFEDLHPRAQHAVTALQDADKALVSFHSFAVWFFVTGGAWAVVNIALLQLFGRRASSENEAKI